MTAEEYIAAYGATLTEAEKRYVRAFGAPAIYEGPSRRPTAPGLRIADEPTADPLRAVLRTSDADDEEDERLEREARDAEDEEEAAEWGAL